MPEATAQRPLQHLEWECLYPPTLGLVEQDNFTKRRSVANLVGDPPSVGVACSGGGIRSATVCLGFFQALARAGLLKRVDYISTVSGGGYFGSFLGTLFIRSRGLKATPEEILSDSASRPVSWLRDNGRYIAPSGAADYGAIVAVYTRNWLAVHYVLGLSFLTASLAVLIARPLLDKALHPQELPVWLRVPVDQLLVVLDGSMNFSPFWALVALVLGLWYVPLVWSYWLTQYGHSWSRGARSRAMRHASPIRSLGAWATLIAVLIAAALLCYDWRCHLPEEVRRSLPLLGDDAGCAPAPFAFSRDWLAAYVVEAGVLALAYWIGAEFRGRGKPSVEERKQYVRAALTRCTTWAVECIAALGFLSLFDTLSVLIYWHSSDRLQATGVTIGAAGAGLTGAATFFLHKILPMVLPKRGVRRWLSESALASIAGFALLGVVMIAWHVVAYRTTLTDKYWTVVLTAFAVCFLMSLFVSPTLSFLNLSALHQFYAARLKRAYMGATNPNRQDMAVTDPDDQRRSIVKEITGDDIAWGDYRPHEYGGPQHVIGVTVNHTVRGKATRGSSLEVRDRKGVSMALGQAGISVGTLAHAIWGDGRLLRRADTDDASVFAHIGERMEAEECMLSRWVGISGAAFSTGLGTRTRTGVSILMGLANIRLGYWWVCQPARVRLWQRVLGATFATQRYLYSELTARFPGARPPRWYLSDGGHAENTGAYELVRRRLRYIVVLDNGADPDYQFEDFANLARRLRIDFGVTLDPLAPADAARKYGLPQQALGSLAELRRMVRSPLGIKTAHQALSAYEVVYRDGTPPSLLLLVKPTLLGDEPEDVIYYAATHAHFPQEPTADQFFDEAQWESYRRLGEKAGERLCAKGFAFAEPTP